VTAFKFSKENVARVKEILTHYPSDRKASAILPLFELAQRQCGGWLPMEAIKTITEMLGVSVIRGYEVATFYTMFNLKPVGKYHLQVCGTIPCMLRGSEQLKRVCKRHLGIENKETTKDGLFTLSEVECLGACTNAPVVQINDVYYEDLDEKSFLQILKDLEAGREVKPGSVLGRQGSAPYKGKRRAHAKGK